MLTPRWQTKWLVLTITWAVTSGAWAMSSTDVLLKSEESADQLAQLMDWPEGTVRLMDDPLRKTVWHWWFSECSNDIYSAGFDCADSIQVNRLIALLGEIEADSLMVVLSDAPAGGPVHVPQHRYPVVFEIGTQKVIDKWYERLPIEADSNRRIFGVHKYDAPPKAKPPTLTVYLGSNVISPAKLDIPAHVDVRTILKDEATDDRLHRQINRVANKHTKAQNQNPAAKPPGRGCPTWAKIDWPRPSRFYEGKWGLPEPFPSQQGPIAPNVAGIDHWQANHFLVFNEQTSKCLYGPIAPFTVEYPKGLLPRYEAAVARYSAGLKTDREKAVAFVTQALPELVLHPEMPPLGPACPDNRNADDETLLASGKGWCNEQARVFVRLCQVAGIPARLIFLFYTPPRGGHVVAEFCAEGRWCMADASWFCVFPDETGQLASAADIHRNDADKRRAGRVLRQRLDEINALSDDQLVGRKFAHVTDENQRRQTITDTARQMREKFCSRTAEELANEFWKFGVMACPLPPSAEKK